MATLKKKLDANVDGDYYVDNTCINCSACRVIAPNSFDESDGYSRVYHQPASDDERHRAQMALLSCPTSSIGSVEKHDMTQAQLSFPDPIDGPVSHCGFHSKKSFGATSYFIERPSGNVLVDSPRFVKSLVSNIEQLGGIRYIFLSHKDDVADHQKFRDHFGAERILSEYDINNDTKSVEIKINETDDLQLNGDLVVIPTPGHTRGSACLLFDNRYLFTGDHLYQNPKRDFPTAFINHCWYSWPEQIKSMEKLANYAFEWILPGHGMRAYYPSEIMAPKMAECVAWMKEQK